MLGLKTGRAGQWVTAVNGKREHSKTWYQVPLFNMEGYLRLARACGVLRIAHIETGRRIRGASSNLPDAEKGTTKVIWEWERADMVIGQDNVNSKPEHLRGRPKEGFPLEIMGPLGFYTRKDLEELNRRN
jgi:hypothetical protein